MPHPKHAHPSRRGGLVAQARKRDARARLEYEIEAARPSLLPVLRHYHHKVPLRPTGCSRVEWFTQFADEMGEAERFALAAKQAEADLKAMIAEHVASLGGTA